jgi:hypothetical protein
MHENPLLWPRQQPHFHQHVHLAVPVSGLADHLAQFFVAPLRLERPVDRGGLQRKVGAQECAKETAQAFLPRAVVVAVLIQIGRGNYVAHSPP